jgi:hypothetical protein
LESAAALLTQEDRDSDRPASGDILIITDGQVFGTESVLDRVRRKGIRVHCLGIGSASQDRFLAQLRRKPAESADFSPRRNGSSCRR